MSAARQQSRHHAQGQQYLELGHGDFSSVRATIGMIGC
jgi:hypothetical protein